METEHRLIQEQWKVNDAIKNIIEQNDFGFAKKRAIIAQRYLIVKTKK